MPFGTYAPVTGLDPIGDTIIGGLNRLQNTGTFFDQLSNTGGVSLTLPAGTYLCEYNVDDNGGITMTVDGKTGGVAIPNNPYSGRFPIFVDSNSTVSLTLDKPSGTSYIKFYDISEHIDLSGVASVHGISSGGTLSVNEVSYIVGGLDDEVRAVGPDNFPLDRGLTCNTLTDANITFFDSAAVTKIPLSGLISSDFTVVSKQLAGETHTVNGERLVTTSFSFDGSPAVKVDGRSGGENARGASLLGRLTVAHQKVTGDVRLVGLEFP